MQQNTFMKTNTLTIISFILISCSVSAQSKNEPAVFLKAGLNLANVSISDNGDVDEAKILPSFQVGLMGDIPLTDFLAIQPGLFFTGKGSKTQHGTPNDATYFKATSNPFYIEVPVNITFKVPLGDAKFFAGAGPYVAMGIAGKNKTEGKYLGIGFNSNDKIDFSNDDPTTSYEEGAGYGILKRFDYGMNGTVGFEGKAALVSINYGLGLSKISSGTKNSQNDNNKHRVLSLTIGFKL